MKLKSIHIKEFKRFHELTVSNIPETTRLVLLTGPNGSGKTSLFEAFNFWLGHAKQSVHYEPAYHLRTSNPHGHNWNTLLQHIQLRFHGHDDVQLPQSPTRKEFYIRSAYRHEADFSLNGIQSTEDILHDSRRPHSLIQQEQRVSDNYQRMVANAVEAVFNDSEARKKTGEEIADELIGEVRAAMARVFEDLMLEGPGNPLKDGAFRFSKGSSAGFHYKNLSGGEKAAFDLLLDFVVKRRAFNDTVYCIDEPELHMHTRLQAKLLDVMFDLIPDNCQLWLSTHSIGMARKAAELHSANPGQVAFIDFHDQDFDQPVQLQPIQPDRRFWQQMFRTALDDLAELVVPRYVIFCEGKRLGETEGRKPSFDVEVYQTIFSSSYPDAEFIPLGGTNDVKKDGATFGLLMSRLAPGISSWKVMDRDDLHADEVAQLKAEGVQVLLRRDLESYLWDDEILGALCRSVDQPEKAEELVAEKHRLLSENSGRGKPIDDVKAIAGQLYNRCKQALGLTQRGNDAESFARLTLAPLVTPETKTYQELESIVMSPVIGNR